MKSCKECNISEEYAYYEGIDMEKCSKCDCLLCPLCYTIHKKNCPGHTWHMKERTSE